MVSATMAERLRALAKHEAAFGSPDSAIGHWAEVTSDADGVMQMPWYVYGEAAGAFIADAYAFAWVADFDWVRWAASSKGRRLLADPALVARVSAAQLARLLTVIIRGDRFSEGELAGAFESGMLGAILRRAAELAESS
jgi:hypothetical protein